MRQAQAQAEARPAGSSQRWSQPADVCIAPLVYNDRRIRQDVINIKEAAAKAGAPEIFLPVVAPASAAHNAINDYYKTEEEYVYAMAEALKQEYEIINAAGVLVQADDAVLANAYDYLMAISPERYRQWAELRIEALNYALSDIPEENVRYHLCYGSWHAPHVADAPLEDIVDLILRVKAQAYSLEAANVRHEHEWRVWEDVKLPDGRMLIPGVVTHHTISVEHPRLVADRIVRYANIVGRENVIAGTDCGFAQGSGTQRVHPQIQWAKLQALKEGAEIATRELWKN
jgi:5-methyltetrahydropteroyltriglutamate--homocysteine methyltransferase